MGIFVKKKDLLACPKCGSINKRKPAGTTILDAIGPGLTEKTKGPNHYICKDCGYDGVFFLIDDLEGFKKSLKEKKQESD